MIAKRNLIQFILENKILTFGDFTTNAGRKSPYFCNFGDLASPKALRELADYYADEIIEAFGSKVDNVFGPAYKGISLAIMVADSLSTKLGRNVTFTFNRKEVKDHGEKGLFLGHSYTGGEKVVIVEDVITSGKSLLKAFEQLENMPVEVIGSVVCIDREESTLDGQAKARDILAKTTQKPCIALLSISDLLETLAGEEELQTLASMDKEIWQRIKSYQESYF